MSELAPTSAPATRQGTSDPDEFQLPVPGLFADLELGRGSVHLPDEFLQSTSLVKLQIVRDWQRSLGHVRREAIRQFADELSRGRPEMDVAQRQALVRSTFASLCIELPAAASAVPAET
jgi:hypothetical protein